MTVDERIERLTGIVDTLAASVVAHDNQIEALAASVVAHDNQIDALVKVAEKHEKDMANLIREWQAYLRRLPAQ